MKGILREIAHFEKIQDPEPDSPSEAAAPERAPESAAAVRKCGRRPGPAIHPCPLPSQRREPRFRPRRRVRASRGGAADRRRRPIRTGGSAAGGEGRPGGRPRPPPHMPNSSRARTCTAARSRGSVRYFAQVGGVVVVAGNTLHILSHDADGSITVPHLAG